MVQNHPSGVPSPKRAKGGTTFRGTISKDLFRLASGQRCCQFWVVASSMFGKLLVVLGFDVGFDVGSPKSAKEPNSFLTRSDQIKQE